MATESARTSFNGVRTRALNSDAGAGSSPPATPASAIAFASDADSSRESSESGFGRLADVPRWLFLGLLIYAPWAYGCTRDWSFTLLNAGLFGVAGLWIVTCLCRLSMPRVHPVLLIAALLLLAQGWWMTLNSGWIYDSEYHPHACAQWSEDLPGSVNYAVSLPSMTGLSGILIAICFAADTTRHRIWRKRVLRTMAVTGISIVILGLMQKVTRSPGIFWQAEGHEATFFGTFRYHGNAGAFINLTWPLAAIAFFRAIRRDHSGAEALFWGAGMALCLTGALVNTSRAGGAIAGLIFVGGAAVHAFRRFHQRGDALNPVMIGGAVLGLAALVLFVVTLGGFDSTFRRWGHFGHEMSLSNPRLRGALVCIQMLPKSGFLGFGPGTFVTAFPFFNTDTSAATSGLWLQAHQDYLQTLIEWGWLGALGWAVIAFGGIASLLRSFRSHDGHSSSSERLAAAGIVAALTATFIHALVDFPLQIASLQLYAGVLVGCCWNRGCNSSTRPGRRHSRRER